MRISDWSSDVCSSDLADSPLAGCLRQGRVLASSEQGRGAATPRSTIAAPLIVAGEPLGALAAVADRIDAFGAPEAEMLRSVRATVALLLLSSLARTPDLAAARHVSQRLPGPRPERRRAQLGKSVYGQG